MEQSEKKAIVQTVKSKCKRVCAVPGCLATRASYPHYTFYKQPKDKLWAGLWSQKMQLDSSITWYHVCEIHFEEKFLTFKRRLKKCAIPTLHLPPGSDGVPPLCDDAVTESMSDEEDSLPDDDDYVSALDNLDTPSVPVKIEHIDPDAATCSSHAIDLPVKSAEATKIVDIKEENDCLTVFVDEERENYQEHHEQVFVQQPEYVTAFKNLTEAKRKSHKQKYSTEYKLFALDLYFESPNVYRFLYRTFRLPRISTIYRLCIPKTSALDDDLFRALSVKIEGMTSEQKQCVVCIGTISLSPTIEYDAVNDKINGFHELDGVQTLEPALNCLIILVRGLFHNWKQAIAFSFLRNSQDYRMNNLFIDEAIKRLFAIGLNVRAFVSDIKSDSLTAVEDRIINKKHSFFYVNINKIYYMYDPLHLMSNIRDNFVINNITFFVGMAAKWAHVVKCYEHDRTRGMLRLAPQLSEDNVILKENTHGGGNKLKFTTELFNRTTAAAIYTCIDLKVLQPTANDTVAWILKLSKLMDMLNFSTVHPPEDKSAVFSGEKTQVDFLVEMLSLFPKLNVYSQRIGRSENSRVRKEKNYVTFINGFRTTINSILLLHEELKAENYCLPIVGLTHDCLNDFFEKARLLHGEQPTAKEMITCITTFPIFNIFQYSCKQRRCPDRAMRGLETFISRARQVPDIDMYEEPIQVHVDQCGDESAEFPVLQLPHENKVEHLSLYLLNKAHRKYCKCDAMSELHYSSNVNNIVEDSKSNSNKEKTYLISPHFVEFIEVLDLKFKEYFTENRLTRSIAGLQSFVKNVTCELPCTCIPIDFIKQLFLRYRLYSVLKINNEFNSINEHPLFVVNDL